MRIYVIDDEPTVLMASEQIIRRALPDAEVTAFLSAAKALETLNNTSEPLDVCFCDIEMPGINGLEFALRLKQISPETKIVFVTAYSESMPSGCWRKSESQRRVPVKTARSF